MAESVPIVGIVIINYRNAKVTQECLESLLRLDYPNYRILVVENSAAEAEREIQSLTAWSRTTTPSQAMNPYFQPWLNQTRRVDPRLFVLDETALDQTPVPASLGEIALIRCSENYGFGGGMNVAMKWLHKNNIPLVWLLNNDTYAMPDSLTHLVTAITMDPQIGMTGSKLRYYSKPELLNLIGGNFNPSILHFGFLPIGLAEKDVCQYDREVRLDSLAMASCIARLDAMEKIGFFDPGYFLYCEDLDLFEKVKRAGYQLGYEWKSLVFHMESITTGKTSRLSTYYYARNKTVFYRKYYRGPMNLVGLILSVCRDVIGRIRRREMENARVILSGFIHGLQNKKGMTYR